MDRHARKQVLLTRIAFERMELRRDLARVQQATNVSSLLRTVAGDNLGKTLLGAMLPGKSSWLPMALSLLRRYKVAAALVGGLAPTLGGRKGWRRIGTVAALASAAWLGWRAAQGLGKKP
jgi:hypothetical protein